MSHRIFAVVFVTASFSLVVGCDPGSRSEDPPSKGQVFGPGEATQSSKSDTSDVRPRETAAGAPKPAADNRVRSRSGLEYAVLRQGSGSRARPGGRVRVHCRGWTVSRTGVEKVFVDTRRAGSPDEYVLSQDSLRTWALPQVPAAQASLIPGLYEGIVGMQQGEWRRLEIPSHLAYGTHGYPGVVPGKADLVVEVELLNILPPE